MICEHSLIFSRAQLGFEAYKPEELVGMRPVRHRLVRTHPTSGRKSLFLSAHIGTILGWPQPEALAFIRDLTEHATQEQFVYSHQWTQHDLVIWDNRTTMHRVRRYDDLARCATCAAPRPGRRSDGGAGGSMTSLPAPQSRQDTIGSHHARPGWRADGRLPRHHHRRRSGRADRCRL